MRDKGLRDGQGADRAQSLLAEGKPLEDALRSADGLGEEAILRFLAEAFEIPFIDAERLEKQPPAKEFLSTFPARLLLRHQLLPLEEKHGVILVATSRISDHFALDDLRMASGRGVAPAFATSTA